MLLIVLQHHNLNRGQKMPIGTLHEGITVDFADVLLIINVFAIAMLLGVLVLLSMYSLMMPNS